MARRPARARARATMVRRRRARLGLLLAVAVGRHGSLAFEGCRRRVYVDLGANWANTLRLHDKLQHHVRQSTQHPANTATFNNCTSEWEIYAFEASPVMHPFVDAFVNHLNGRGNRPTLTVPPVGGSLQMLAYAKHFGCPHRHNKTEYASMYRCMNRIFAEPYKALAVDLAFNDSKLIQQRLDEAASPNVGTTARYTFVPAAVGAQRGSLDISWPAGLLLYVDEPEEPVPRPPGVPPGMRVTVVDWPRWLKHHFRPEDIVIVKMDVEGAEHEILWSLAADNSIQLIDVLGLECHGEQPKCKRLLEMISKRGVRFVSEAAYSPLSMGVDRFSHPKDLMPIDPRRTSTAG